MKSEYKVRGTFTYTATHITFNMTHIWISGINRDWVERDPSTLSTGYPAFIRNSSPVSYSIWKPDNSDNWFLNIDGIRQSMNRH